MTDKKAKSMKINLPTFHMYINTNIELQYYERLVNF